MQCGLHSAEHGTECCQALCHRDSPDSASLIFLVGKKVRFTQGISHLIYAKSGPLGSPDLPFPRYPSEKDRRSSVRASDPIPSTKGFAHGLWHLRSLSSTHHPVNMTSILERLHSPQGKICIISWLGFGDCPKHLLDDILWGIYVNRSSKSSP